MYVCEIFVLLCRLFDACYFTMRMLQDQMGNFEDVNGRLMFERDLAGVGEAS